MLLVESAVEREGHANVPAKHREADYRLGKWVAARRQEHRLGKLHPERAAQLESFPGWESFGALLGHMKFVHEHHKKVVRIAFATDSPIG